MRYRFALAAALVLVLVPAVSTAQLRAPRPLPGRRPSEPVPLGKQPEVVARSQAVQRSRYAVETYPLISRVGAPGFAPGSPTSWWTSLGTGARLDWRVTNHLSWTADLTSSFLGGPANTETFELGARYLPRDRESRLRPFADVRIGYEHASESFSQPTDLGIGPASPLAHDARFSRGFGAIAGVGAEYALTSAWGLVSSASAMRSNMVVYRFSGISAPNNGDGYRMTSYRLAVGLRYSRVKALRHLKQERE